MTWECSQRSPTVHVFVIGYEMGTSGTVVEAGNYHVRVYCSDVRVSSRVYKCRCVNGCGRRGESLCIVYSSESDSTVSTARTVQVRHEVHYSFPFFRGDVENVKYSFNHANLGDLVH